jgi:hypothetical protein
MSLMPQGGKTPPHPHKSLPAGNFAGILRRSPLYDAIRVLLCSAGSRTWSEFPAPDGQGMLRTPAGKFLAMAGNFQGRQGMSIQTFTFIALASTQHYMLRGCGYIGSLD